MSELELWPDKLKRIPISVLQEAIAAAVSQLMDDACEAKISHIEYHDLTKAELTLELRQPLHWSLKQPD